MSLRACLLTPTLCAVIGAPLWAQPGPGIDTGVQRLSCLFDETCIDRRPCFETRYELTVTGIAGGGDLARLHYAGEPDRQARISTTGVWTTYTTLPEYNFVDVLDVAKNGRATLVRAQPNSAAEVISRNGTCTPERDPA